MLSPVDLIPSTIPVLGQLDDLAALLLGLRQALNGCPPEIRHQHMERVGLNENALDADLRTIAVVTVWLGVTAGRLCARAATFTIRTILGKELGKESPQEMQTDKQRVLFLCTHNSARSQMAEGWLRYLGGSRFEVESAGTEATGVRPLAIRVMREAGIDISMHQSKTLDRFLAQPFDLVITVCDDAVEACPVFPGPARRIHWSLPDPSQATGSETEQLEVYRQVRDAIRASIEQELVAAPR